MSGKTHEAVLFSKCKGLNDNFQTTAAYYDEKGLTEVIGCRNLTVTHEGKLIKVPALETVITHDDSIDVLTAGSSSRLFMQSGSTLHVVTGTDIPISHVVGSPGFTSITGLQNFTAGVKAKYIHTPIDTRVSYATAGNDPTAIKQYKVPVATVVGTELALGTYAGPPTTKAFAKMPLFSGGFVHNSKLYASYGSFLQYSEDYYYDVWNIGDGFIGSATPVLQSGAIPGCVLTMHSNGVTAYFGTGPHDFVKKFYPCKPLEGTLYSGFVSKVYDYVHCFLCYNGFYTLEANGKLTNQTLGSTDYVFKINNSYNSCGIHDGKYLAFGSTSCVEFDFLNKALLLRDNFGITTCAFWDNELYLGAGVALKHFAPDEVEDSTKVISSVRLPFNTWGVDNNKQTRFLYFTGNITGTVDFILRNQNGDSVTKTISNVGYVQNYKVTSLRTVRGNKLSVEIVSKSGKFKLEELRASFMTVARSY
jgi:hypothetical protein